MVGKPHVFAFRRGLDGRAIPPVIFPGDTPREVVVAKACEILGEKASKRPAAFLSTKLLEG